MKTETAEEIREALRSLKVIYNNVYDFDYDEYVLWHLNEAIEHLKELCNKMKTHTTITDLTHEDLVDLLCTATYGSSWLEIYAPDRDGLDITDSDCREDVWAKTLLAGKKIECIDHYAEGEVYGDLGRVDEDEDGIYLIDLERIYLGLADALDGTFPGDADIKTWARECAEHFIAGEGEMDEPEAACLMQIIMFGDVIY